MYVIGLDVGTSGVKSTVLTSRANVALFTTHTGNMT